LQVHASQRDAVNQNLVRVSLAAVDRPQERVAHRARQRREDELLDLPSAVADRDRPGVEFLLRDIAADLRRARLEHRRLRGHSHLLSGRADFQLEVECQRLGHLENHVLAQRAFESRRRDRQPVCSRRQVGQAIYTRLGGGRGGLDPCLDIRRFDGRPDDDRAGWIGDRPVQRAAFTLSE
jgi:hypothetical protein